MAIDSSNVFCASSVKFENYFKTYLKEKIEDLTFIFVTFAFHAENCCYHNDNYCSDACD